MAQHVTAVHLLRTSAQNTRGLVLPVLEAAGVSLPSRAGTRGAAAATDGGTPRPAARRTPQNAWARGHVGTWARGHVGTWARGHVGTWVCG
jgi:hypothetical protein